jgi:L-cysteine:1D-myo-inositol 2-amino-2-deoxy-alpha-D-glucopyranoside ligase
VKLYNSLSQSVEPFVYHGNQVSLYVCGITPYDTTHLGHAFTYTIADILVRFLESQGLKVNYAQNVTDIDDDILRKSREVGDDWLSLGNRWTAHYIHDMISLNVRPPDYYPRATDVIPEIIDLVKRLLDRGVAYQSGNSVYYDIHSWPEFGKLNRLDYKDMLAIANERGNFPDDPLKRDPLDFVLWQSKKQGEPAWESPWGPGRPGWHIECSTMSTKYLGETVDIHSGGGDLCFPHHECEIAQVEPLYSQEEERSPFVRYWLHVAMVRHEGEKMSKSLGNLVWVQELLKTYSADGLRLYLASHHYRDSWSYDEKELKTAQELANGLRDAITLKGGKGSPLDTTNAREAFTQAMEDDLDTPRAYGVLADLLNRTQDAARDGGDIQAAQRSIREMSVIFGLRLDQSQPDEQVIEGWNRHLARFE